MLDLAPLSAMSTLSTLPGATPDCTVSVNENNADRLVLQHVVVATGDPAP